MIALPKARSQGSNGAGGGALAAFKGKSAAKAEPVIARSAATKTIFFMTIPITLKDQSDFRRPQGKRQSAVTEFLNVVAIWNALPVAGSKKDEQVLTF